MILKKVIVQGAGIREVRGIMRFIETLKDGDRISEIFLCKTKSTAMTKNGKEYENVALQDKTGTLDGKIWDPSSAGISEFEVLDYVEVTGVVTCFNGTLQLKIDRARKVNEGEYEPADYLPVSRYNIADMYKELMGYVNSVQNPYIKKLLERFFVEDSDFIEKYKSRSAAKTFHHGFMGGLLEHSLSLTRLCAQLADLYDILNRDLLLACAMLHDAGKVREFTPFPMNDYTEEGNLLGHIVMGSEMISEKVKSIDGFPPKLEAQIKHCILSHHGELEYGSPKKPSMAEAIALSMADMLDSRMEILKELFESKENTGSEWMGFSKIFEANIMKTQI